MVTVYLITDVPAATPVTNPVEFIVATLVFTDFQTPPEVVLDNCVVFPTHIVVLPVIAPIVGRAFTITLIVSGQLLAV